MRLFYKSRNKKWKKQLSVLLIFFKLNFPDKQFRFFRKRNHCLDEALKTFKNSYLRVALFETRIGIFIN